MNFFHKAFIHILNFTLIKESKDARMSLSNISDNLLVEGESIKVPLMDS